MIKNINIPLILFIGFELCYYLLIAQTGIVEVFHTDMFIIGFLPLGGVIGSLMAVYIPIKKEYKVYALLMMQFVITLYYPDFSLFQLFVLGIAVGGMAPLIMDILKKASSIDMVLALGIAYVVGTSLFNTDPVSRDIYGLFFTCITFIAFIFTQQREVKKNLDAKEYIKYSLFFMTFWVFLDSALFETLSRDIDIPIWRGGYSFEIMAFHILGVIGGVVLRFDHYQKAFFILILFSMSYFFYFLREPLFLSMVYPFVISYYNITILQSLYKIKSLKTIGVYMIFIGWVASGLGLFVAYVQLIIFIPILFLIVLLYMINQQSHFHNINNKGVYHG